MTVTDTATGRVKIYQNAANRPGCGGIDTAAFPDTGLSSVSVAPASSLAPGDGRTLRLFGGRYSILLTTTDTRTGRTASGFAMSQDDRNGYFSLPEFTGDPAFPEVFVRVSEQSDGSLMFHHTGLTDLAYTLTVTDTVTSAVQTYGNDVTDSSHPCGGVAVVP